MRIWAPKDQIPQYTLEEGDEYKICEVFSKKINCIKNGQIYVPDLSKDVYLSRTYELESMNFYEFNNRENCVRSIQCDRLRKQNFDLLQYTREQKIVIEALVKKYHEETDLKRKLIIKGLARIKSSNLTLVEEARKKIVYIFEKGQEAGDFLEEMLKIIKNVK